MNAKIYNFTYDFIQSQEHYLVIEGSEKRKIYSDDLVKAQVNMLKSNEIDRLLSIKVEEIDFLVKFFYNISAKRILSHFIRSQKLSIDELYSIFYNISLTLQASQEYMLEEHSYIIHKDFIFVGTDIHDIYMVYLPLKTVNEKPFIQNELKELLIYLVGHVDSLTGDGLQKLLTYLNDSSFTINGFIEKLEHLQTSSHTNPYKPLHVRTIEPTIESEIEELKSPQEQMKHDESSSKEQIIEKQTSTTSTEKETVITSEKEKPKKEPNKIVVGAISILGIALIWKLFESYPSEGMLFISIGASIAVIAIAYYFIAVHGKVSFIKKKTKQKKPRKENKRKLDTPHRGMTPKQIDKTPQVTHSPQITKADSVGRINEEEYYRSLQNQTTLLSQSDATVLLDEEEAFDTPHLEVDRKGRIEKIYIDQDRFTIGRNPTGVEYVENTIGVSRVHLEIIREIDQYMVRDLGSKNGSKLNGKIMVSYKNYLLQHGDTLQLGKVQYVFKMRG